MHKRNGFSVIELILILAAVGVIGALAWFGTQGGKKEDMKSGNDGSGQKSSQSTTDSITWMSTGDSWQASGTPPTCKEPIKFSLAPSDLSRASAILYPGQSRGGNYKPHGGFRFDGSTKDVTVKAIYDGRLISGSRYIEAGETQYMFTMVNDCGIAYRFDHLLTLSPRLQAEAEKLPAAQLNNSQTTDYKNPINIKTGEVIATSVGFPKMNNIGYDLGVYDYRKRNSAASSSAFLAAHQGYLAQAAYAICWFDMFPSADSAIIKSLPAGDQASGKTSDYCKS